MSAQLIDTNGLVRIVEPENGTDFSLEELQGFVGGYIEIVYLSDNRIMVINEEGKLNNLPINNVATMLYRHDTIVGNVLVCNSKMVK